ncbi:hypothetical protein BWI17_13255 [Betaproteobacteria bacterium GR16-43]|nr:hypothetical protein BWI17_13255 [Betaproteobacteria bacterium GR16-43]
MLSSRPGDRKLAPARPDARRPRRPLIRLLPAVLLAATLASGQAGPVDPGRSDSRAVLVLDEADPSDGVPTAFSTALRRALIDAQPHVAVYAETLDFTRFGDARSEAALRTYLEEKYRGMRFAAIVAVGAPALAQEMRWRPGLWRGTPIVFGAIDPASLSRMNLEPGVTGIVMQRKLGSMLDAARLAVPGLKGVVILGGTLPRDVYRRHYVNELPALAREVAVTDLTGRPLREQLESVRTLPADTAILYTSLFVDDEGTRYSSPEALAEIARVANRPILVDVASLVGSGATGGFAIDNVSYGREVAALTLRVIDGANVGALPIQASEYTRPIFDHRQLERWRIREADLPSGSDIRFRSPSAWEQYRWQIVLIAATLIAQTALIAGLVFQWRRRLKAEDEVRMRRAELARASRLAMAGQLTAMIAHEINQPLSAILANASAGELLLERDPNSSVELRMILADIASADLRASEVIRRVRALVTAQEVRRELVGIDGLVHETLSLLKGELGRAGVASEATIAPGLPPIPIDRIQMQQAIINLCLNALEAMASGDASVRRLEIDVAAAPGGGLAIVVSDTGPGIPPEDLPKVFDSFFTTKPHGTGLGLAITRSIVEAHHGWLSAENRVGGGARLRIVLPKPAA